jgi:hypothetical protein
MQTALCPTCQLEKPLDAGGRIAFHVAPMLGKRSRLQHNRCPGEGMIFVGPALDLFDRRSLTPPPFLYWADDCPHCYPDQAGSHEPHCRHAPGGGAA